MILDFKLLSKRDPYNFCVVCRKELGPKQLLMGNNTLKIHGLVPQNKSYGYCSDNCVDKITRIHLTTGEIQVICASFLKEIGI